MLQLVSFLNDSPIKELELTDELPLPETFEDCQAMLPPKYLDYLDSYDIVLNGNYYRQPVLARFFKSINVSPFISEEYQDMLNKQSLRQLMESL